MTSFPKSNPAWFRCVPLNIKCTLCEGNTTTANPRGLPAFLPKKRLSITQWKWQCLYDCSVLKHWSRDIRNRKNKWDYMTLMTLMTLLGDMRSRSSSQCLATRWKLQLLQDEQGPLSNDSESKNLKKWFGNADLKCSSNEKSKIDEKWWESS